MKKKPKLLKILKGLAFVILILIVGFFVVRAIGKAIYNQTPEGGINESMYVDINGTKQWINIYGEDVNNPVLLYLHGGPGSATSDIDYAFTRKWADVYTVVTWDQRNCGKSYDAEQNNVRLLYRLPGPARGSLRSSRKDREGCRRWHMRPCSRRVSMCPLTT